MPIRKKGANFQQEDIERGKRIRSARDFRGVTQKQLADEMNIDASQISRWESGVKPHDMKRLADHLRVNIEFLTSGKREPDPNFERHGEIALETTDKLQIRTARRDEAGALVSILGQATAGALTQVEDLSNEEIFERWLNTGLVRFCLAETGDRVRGFYSLFPLKPSAYESLKTEALHHDDIAREHLVEGVFDHGAPPGGTRKMSAVLFVLDLEVVKSGTARRAALYLTLDLADEILRASRKVQLKAVAALGATPKGREWSEIIAFNGPDTRTHPYFRVLHDNWTLYERDGVSITRFLGELRSRGWPGGSPKKYPYFAEPLLKETVKPLGQLVREQSAASTRLPATPPTRTKGMRLR